MKRPLVCLLPFALVACDPFPKDEDEVARKSPRPTATPTATPKPGAWMTEKKNGPLDQKPHK